LDTIDKSTFDKDTDRYSLKSGAADDAPACPYGNKYQWIGYDNLEGKYVRLTKSVFKLLIQKLN
jgi:hypothetical protein